MKLRICMIAAALVALSSTAFAHDPTLFGGEPHTDKPAAAAAPTTCEELEKTATADLDTTDAEVKKLQQSCKQKAAADPRAKSEEPKEEE